MRFQLRHATAEDRDFLFQLHCSTMREYIERTWGWDEDWQFGDFEGRFDPQTYEVIVVGGERVGFLEVERGTDEIFIANIQVAPWLQGRGLGTAVIRQVMQEAIGAGLPTTLQVLGVNHRARRLYERLGFRVSGHVPPHLRMRCGP